MLVGTQIAHDGSVGDTEPFYSPSFPRGGLAATFSVDVTHVGGSPNLVITIQHKAVEDTAWTDAGSFTGITAPGVSAKDVSDLKEEVRLSFKFTTGSLGDFVFLILPVPSWRPY